MHSSPQSKRTATHANGWVTNESNFEARNMGPVKSQHQAFLLLQANNLARLVQQTGRQA